MSANQEHEPQSREGQPPPAQENPLSWTGKVFAVSLHEQTGEDGKSELSVQVSACDEVIVFAFHGSVHSYTTTVFSTAEAPATSAGEGEAEGTKESTPPSTPEAVATPTEQERKPTKIAGTLQEIGELEQTKKQGRPVLRFQVLDEGSHTKHRIVAFDTIAEGLAAPEMALKVDQSIKMLAWKHTNTVHIKGQEKQVEEWYAQKVWYEGKVFEKPQSSKPKPR